MEERRFDNLAKGLARVRSRRATLRLMGGALATALGLGASGARATPAKRPLCHATGDPANPYVVIEVAEPAWDTHLAHGDAPYVDCCPGEVCPTPGHTCGGGGVAGACGCTRRTTCAPGETGVVDDGCGGTLACGCPGGTVATACGCCPIPDHGLVTCDPATGCGIECDRGYQRCGDTCIPVTSCCVGDAELVCGPGEICPAVPPGCVCVTSGCEPGAPGSCPSDLVCRQGTFSQQPCCCKPGGVRCPMPGLDPECCSGVCADDGTCTPA